MAGTYSQYNLANEAGMLKNIFEANAGYRLSKRHNLWIDAGIMPSHIGFESAVGADCPTLTRSILADNSPYYEAGVKLSYTTPDEKWFASVMYLNGWQRIGRTPGNRMPAWGTQLTFSPSGKFSLNWSSYAGTEGPDSLMQWRVFQNFYAKWLLHPRLNLILGFDIGNQQKFKGASSWHVWYAPVAVIQYVPSSGWRLALRGEGYSDKGNVMIATPLSEGFRTAGYSLNVDFFPMKRLMFRAEARALHAQKPVFFRNGQPAAQNYFFTAAASFAF